MFEILAIVFGAFIGAFGVWFLRKASEAEAPEAPEAPDYQPNEKLKEIDDEIPDSSGSVSVDDLVSWADRERKRSGNADDDGGGV